MEWCNQSYNEKHAFSTGLKHKVNIPFIVIFKNGEIKRYENQHTFAEEISVSQQAVSTWLKKKENQQIKTLKKFILSIKCLTTIM